MDGFEILDPRFRRFVLPNAPLIKLGEGFGWLEGPVWFADLDCLLVSDIPNDRILRWTEDGGISVFRQPSGFANGHCRDRQGRLIGCSHRNRCITRTELDGTLTVLADRYEGKRLNAPNDMVCKSDGTIWFSDPHYGISTDYEGGKQSPELPPLLYRFDPRDGSLRIMADDFAGPNGLAFSPDERLLYVAETGGQFDETPTQHIRVFDVQDDGARLAGGRIFHAVSPGYADGFRVDEDGNLWSSAGDGVHCIAPDGDAARGDPCSLHGLEPDLRREEPVEAVHLRLAHAVCDLHQPARRAAALSTPAFLGSRLDLPSLVGLRIMRMQ